MILLCIRIQLPNLSLFPEINFASKCAPDGAANPVHFSELLYSLSNAGTTDTRRRFAGVDMYVGADVPSSNHGFEAKHISASTSRHYLQLQKGEVYV